MPEPLALAWAPFARRRARALHRRDPFDCVITTSPPESIHTVGRALQRRGAAWVADVRDAWTFEPLRPRFPTAPQRALDRRKERKLLGRADAVVCVSEPAAADLRDRGIADPLLVRNGADPELLEAADPASVAGLLDPERVSLVYTGRFGSSGRDPRGLVDGLRKLAAVGAGRSRPPGARRRRAADRGRAAAVRGRRRPGADHARRLAAARARAGAPACGRLPAARRPPGAQPARELQAVRVPERRPADPGAGGRHRGRPDRRRNRGRAGRRGRPCRNRRRTGPGRPPRAGRAGPRRPRGALLPRGRRADGRRRRDRDRAPRG